MLHPFDLANLVAADHRLAEVIFGRLERGEGNRQVLIDQLSVALAQHAGAEELVLYPAERDLGRGPEVDENLDDHQVIKDALVVLDRFEADTEEAQAALEAVIDVVREHARIEEDDQLPLLRAEIGDEQMVELGRSFRDQQAKAPTHAHPHAPTNPLTAAGAAVVDLVRDKVNGRSKEVATDASGLLDVESQAVVDALADLAPKPLHLLQPDQARRQPTFADAVARVADELGRAAAEPVSSVEGAAIPGPAGDIPIRIYRPASNADVGLLPVVIFVRGGGWVVADLDTYDASARGLCHRAGAIVVSVDHRTAPEHPFPAAHDDVLAAARWVLAQAASLGGDPQRVAIAGESAGGNMAAATCIALAAAGEPLPVFQLLVYPVTATTADASAHVEAADAKPLYSSLVNWFLGYAVSSVEDLADRRLNLLAVPTADLAGVPPALVVVAGRDPLRDDAEAFADNLRAAGVAVEVARYEGVPHEFFGAAAVIEQAARAQARAAGALRDAFGTAEPVDLREGVARR